MATRAKDITKIIKKELEKQVNLKKLKRNQLQKAGDAMVDAIKDRIAKGRSPIAPSRFFKKYIKPKRYPGKRKPKTPVNLELSGKFLKSLKAIVSMGEKPRIRVGFNSKKSILKEKGHREGANGQEKRPIIPTKNEQFGRKIQEEFLNSVQKILKKTF